jgi:hypothetical protein
MTHAEEKKQKKELEKHFEALTMEIIGLLDTPASNKQLLKLRGMLWNVWRGGFYKGRGVGMSESDSAAQQELRTAGERIYAMKMAWHDFKSAMEG